MLNVICKDFLDSLLISKVIVVVLLFLMCQCVLSSLTYFSTIFTCFCSVPIKEADTKNFFPDEPFNILFSCIYFDFYTYFFNLLSYIYINIIQVFYNYLCTGNIDLNFYSAQVGFFTVQYSHSLIRIKDI